MPAIRHGNHDESVWADTIDLIYNEWDRGLRKREAFSMEMIQGKTTRQLAAQEFKDMVSPYGETVIDVGTGNGRFVYESARSRPDTFFIGIDSDRNNLVKYSHKIYRKPQRGGLSNVLYVIANVENLPEELDGIADTVWIILPWGSLLQGVVQGKAGVLSNIAKIMSQDAALKVFINYDIKYEPAEIERLGLPELTIDYVDSVLAPNYRREGIIIAEATFVGTEETKKLASTWAKRLAYARHRNTLCVEARIDATAIDRTGHS